MANSGGKGETYSLNLGLCLERGAVEGARYDDAKE